MQQSKTRTCLLLVLIGIAWFAECVWSQEAQLIARWGMDEADGKTAEDAVGSHDGELVGDPSWVPAMFGNGLLFDEKTGQYVEIPNHPELEPEESVTVMAWVNVNSAAGRQEIFCYADSYDILINNGVFKTYIHQGGQFPRAPGRTPVQTNRWYFLAMTYDGKALKLYVDGALEGSANLPGGIGFLGLPLRFGNNPAAPGEPWGISGILDEVEIWDRSMTDEEILKAYESPLYFLAVDSHSKLATFWGQQKMP